MWRTKGFGVKGKKLYFRGEFNRKPRLSLLCFINQDGILDVFDTDGTFDRSKFVDCLVSFATKNQAVHQFPGPNSLWMYNVS